MSAELELARFVVNTRYQDLTTDAVEATKRDVFDTMGVGFGGSSAPGIGQVFEYAKEMGGKEYSTVLGFGTRVPPAMAALVNGSLCHALDYDDTHDRAVLHTGAVVVPAAFAVAEYIGGVSGRELITAVALGIEVHCRLGLATKLWIGWMLTPLYGYFGAATAACKLLGLDEEGLLNGWGIAYSQAAGNTETISSGALTKRLQAGFAASGGVLAALLAQKGITGARNSFEGRDGILNLYQRGEYHAAALTDALGEGFEVTNLSFKPYPCCRFNHSGIDAALRIASEYNIQPDQIAEVKAGISSAGYVNNCEPIEAKREPKTPVDAQFSTPYTIACALVKRKVSIVDFSEESLRDPLVLEVASRVYPIVDPDIEKEVGRGIAPTRLEIRVKTGETYSAEVQFAKGHPHNQMTDEEFESKFRSCALAAGQPLSNGTIDQLIDVLRNLEHVDDLSELTGLLK